MKIFGMILLSLGLTALTYTVLSYISPGELINIDLSNFLSQTPHATAAVLIIGVIDLVMGFSLLFTSKTWI